MSFLNFFLCVQFLIVFVLLIHFQILFNFAFFIINRLFGLWQLRWRYLRLRYFSIIQNLFPNDFYVLNIPFNLKPLFSILSSKHLSTIRILIMRIAIYNILVMFACTLLIISPTDCWMAIFLCSNHVCDLLFNISLPRDIHIGLLLKLADMHAIILILCQRYMSITGTFYRKPDLSCVLNIIDITIFPLQLSVVCGFSCGIVILSCYVFVVSPGQIFKAGPWAIILKCF